MKIFAACANCGPLGPCETLYNAHLCATEHNRVCAEAKKIRERQEAAKR